jgi:hypothetical protein
MDFDKVRFISCNEDKLSFYEIRWIKKFNPILNIAHNKIKPVKVKRIKPIKFMHFRKLTRKSIIGIGLLKDISVQRMLDRKKGKEIASLYFRLSHITFFDDILDEIGITQEWRISKPGTEQGKAF